MKCALDSNPEDTCSVPAFAVTDKPLITEASTTDCAASEGHHKSPVCTLRDTPDESAGKSYTLKRSNSLHCHLCAWLLAHSSSSLSFVCGLWP